MSEEYISPEELKQKGFAVRGAVVVRLSLIERYYEKGWLNYGDRRLSPEIRLEAADRLAADFYFSRFQNASAVDWQKERVDGGYNKPEPAAVLDARGRFFRAIKEIPPEFWPAVQDVVLYERRPEIENNCLYKSRLYMFKVDLCRGLDRLAWHYGARPSNRKIKAMRTDEKTAPAQTPRRYTIEVK